MPFLEVDDREVTAALKQLHQFGVNVGRTMTRPLRDSAERVLAAAQQKAPQTSPGAFLKKSGQMDVRTSATGGHLQITFGGLAGPYAEVQHEREDFAHSEAEWASKFGKPFPSRNKTTRKYRDEIKGRRSKGVINISLRRNKEPQPRDRKHKITGYRGGQAHFLHGAASSAWNDAEQTRLQQAILAAAEAKYNEAVGKSTP